MKKFLEALPVVAIFGLLLGPSAYFGQWYLFTLFAIFGVLFGIVEVIAIIRTGKSVTQKMWKLREKNPTAVYIICGCMALSWAILIAHFLVQ